MRKDPIHHQFGSPYSGSTSTLGFGLVLAHNGSLFGLKCTGKERVDQLRTYQRGVGDGSGEPVVISGHKERYGTYESNIQGDTCEMWDPEHQESAYIHFGDFPGGKNRRLLKRGILYSSISLMSILKFPVDLEFKIL